MKKLLLLIPVIVCFILDTNAQVINVPADHSTIQAAIDAAVNGDTVLVAEGTWYENINFLGKAITVASLFIQDGDTSHITKTIIDGSKATDLTKASVVTMRSHEDSTSVLMGFTITGGSGTYINLWGSFQFLSGGGVAIINCGGKIIHNIIEDNHLTSSVYNYHFAGAGILIWAKNPYISVVRDNIIRNNSCNGSYYALAGGAMFIDGEILFEANHVHHNTVESTGTAGGAGIFWAGSDNPNQNDVYIRRNRINNNTSDCPLGTWVGGGGIYTGTGATGVFEISNNLVYENSAVGEGGGMWLLRWNAIVCNNTFCNNETTTSHGRNVYISGGGNRLFNNIICSDNEDWRINCFYGYWNAGEEALYAFNNLLGESIVANNLVVEDRNVYLDPLFMPGSFKLSETSPAIGRGLDSMEIGGRWCYGPVNDFAGNTRPHATDPYIDIGAFESEFPRNVLSNADLWAINLKNWKLIPDFHKDSIYYVVLVPDTAVITPVPEIITVDLLATVETDPAKDISSESEADRTTTITVTADDGITQKIYRVLLNQLSTDATLSELSVDNWNIDPEFSSSNLGYTCHLSSWVTEQPEIHYMVNDPGATVKYTPAFKITSTNRASRTATIAVTPEFGQTFKNIYQIEFQVSPVSIDQFTDRRFVCMFPNPVSDKLNVELEQSKSNHGSTIEITNLSGQVIYTGEMDGTSKQVDMSRFSNGIYLVKVTSGETVEVRKVVKD